MSQYICRLCLSKLNLSPIFLNLDQNKRYSLVLALTTGLKIELNDGLPQKICSNCIEMVNRALKLRNQSHTSEITLLNMGFERRSNIKSNKTEKKTNNENIVEENKSNDRSIETNDSDDHIINNSTDREQHPCIIIQNTNIQEQVKGNVISNESKNSNCIYETNDDDFINDSYDNNDFKIEIECEKLTENDNDANINRNETEAKDNAQSTKLIENKKNSKKHRKEIYLSLVDGIFDPKGPVKCKVCKKTVSQWACFISHAKLHLGFKFMCEYCGKSFISSTQLKRHCRSHHGMARELVCKHCSYLALDNAQLLVSERHKDLSFLHTRRVHTGERPYVCDVCGASYYSRKCLIQHIESHRTTDSVQCDRCNRSFKSHRHLARHRYNSHGKVRPRCAICGRTYSRKYLRAHMNTHHPAATLNAGT